MLIHCSARLLRTPAVLLAQEEDPLLAQEQKLLFAKEELLSSCARSSISLLILYS
jgi:hypothetical protein